MNKRMWIWKGMYMEALLLILYTVWAVYSGFKVLTGRNEWLDRKTPASMAVKIAGSFLIGYVIGGFYLIYLILVFLGFMSRM